MHGIIQNNMKFKKIFLVISLFSFFGTACLPLYSADNTPVPYSKNEFPQVMHDIRRFEIITLGALPFVTLNTTLGYSCYQYADHNFSNSYFPNPFGSSSYTQDEQIGILLTSLGICVGIGLTDLIIQIVKRNHKNKIINQNYANIVINPINHNSSADSDNSEEPDEQPLQENE